MSLSGIVEQLRSKRNELHGEVVDMRDTLKSAEAELKQIDQALQALGEKAKTNKTTKPAATKSDVVQAIEAQLSSGDVVEVDALKAAVSDDLLRAGKSRQGFALRFGEALKDKRFASGDDGVSLATHPDRASRVALHQ